MAGQYSCSCGFESASATAFHRHIRRYKDERDTHQRLQPREKPSPRQAPEDVARPAADRLTSPADESASLLTRLAAAAVGSYATSLWGTSPQAVPSNTPEDFQDVSDSPRADTSSDEAEVTRRARAERLESGPIWDLDSDEYSDITKSLLSIDADFGAEDRGRSQASWLKSSVNKVLTTWSSAEEASADGIVQMDIAAASSQVSAEDLEHVLLWKEPMQSAKWFGGGLYVLLCLRHLVHGVELFQPSSAIATAAIAIMIFNSGKQLLSRRPSQSREAGEAALQRRVQGLVTRVLSRLVPLISASVSLTARRLSVHSSKGSRIWLAICLWLIVCVGEIGWLSQASLAMWLWVALFTLPTAYLACRAALDALVDEALAFLGSVLRGGQRGTLLASGAVGVVTFGLADVKLFMRLSLAAIASASVLVWQAHMRRRQLANQKAA